MPGQLEDERSEAHAELAKERWDAHREQHRGEKELAEQKWDSHREQHASIARNLTEYKAQSNEWRGSLSDLRSSFVTRAEIDGLLGKAEGTHVAMNTRMDALEKIIDRAEGSLNTWRGIAAFLGLGGVGAIIWAILQAKP